ncbi:hypothetical protein D6853_06005 [Butyrivibrio sp. X503]|nr:hypothetical protein D6853_06005 [Butyrivibrio sp. X503]
MKFEKKTKRNVSVIEDAEGNKIVVINDIIFKGRRSIQWEDVEKYLKQYVGDIFSIAEDNEMIYIGSELPNEYAGSIYTKKLKGADAKNGWYRYDTRFALPVYGDDESVERYNIFRGRLLIRHASSGKKYLYDVLEIKKETGKSCQT